MAFRRPASSRARLNSTTNPMPPPPAQIPRSRSVMAKSSSSTRSADDVQSTITTAHRPQKSSQDAETNIQVVIRCRRRSEREIQEGSPNIISSAGAKSKELNIEVGIPQPSFGIETFPPVRTYPFDLVFGPEADQAMVYHDVVHPMLEQVLMGYNCTLFAYGQTGTGKTHTMQGDLVPTPLGNPSSNAGMIPRTLFRLFHQLDSSNSDYSVKVSFVELYNEELRDLLAEEFTAPAGSTQPMGMAAKDKNVDNGLKIFDDANKRGVFIQGLEEVTVKDSKDALALLTKGSQRRQIASTKFNDHSSRSHSVFSITVHIKETSTMGDDLLKIGKLNLVDLAGSENIGRSGAENKRAREAGMINQSLLTLGRVINALVDKAQHVPYRESKLTRLLQDSLGGRTKTCIIATISPTRSNVEETLSTLDYAMKAKSIHNKPELNQRMTRNSLLKEYVAEIERLKADLLAAREKNGIFISEETWNEHTAEQELRQTELDEARKQVEIVESQMRSVREEFEQSIALLMKTDGELRDTKAKLEYTEEVLVEKEGQLKATREALEDEVVVRKAYQETESVLDNVATGLKNVAVESIQDMEGLFDKLDRKTKVLTSNTRTASESGKLISKTTYILSQQLVEFKQAASQSLHKLQEDTKQYETRQLDALAIQSERMDQRSRHIQEVLELIQTKDISETKALEIVQKVLQEMHAVLKSEVTVWGEGLMKSCSELCEQTKVAVDKDFPHLEKALQNFSFLIETLAGDARKHIKTEGEHLTRAQTLAADAAAQEIAHLRKQNEELVQMLANERVLADKAKDQLIQRVSGLLGDFTMERDNRLRETVGAMQKQNKDRESIVKTFTEEHAEMMESMQSSASTMGANLHKREVESKKTREGIVKTLKRAREAYKSDLDNITKTVSRSVGTYSTWIHEKSTIMAGSYDEAFDNHLQAKRARLDATMTLDNDLHSDYESMQETIATTSKTLQSYTEQMGHNGSDLETLTETHHSSALKHLEGVQHAATTLAEKGLHEDVPTGTTPRKRTWTYTDQWQLTGSREDLLKGLRERQLSSLNSPQQSTVPEEDEDLQLTATSIPSSPVAPETPIEQDTPIPVISAEAQAGSIQKGLSETKSTVLVMGTLVDSRKRNIPLTRASRRIR